MSKDKKTKTEWTNSENLKWDDLMDAYRETSNTLIGQQSTMHNFSKINKEILDKDPDIVKIIIGYGNTVADIAKTVRETSERHITYEGNKVVENKTGKLKSAEEENEYLGIAAAYLLSEENVMTLTGTAYTEIFSRLKMFNKDDVDGLKKVIEEGKKMIDDAVQTSIKEIEKVVEQEIKKD